MTAKNKRGSGRVTPKGTKNPTKTSKAGKQSGKVARPVTHNRGNR